jgi:VacB/RNase II family 3'-5' exoribonuclease
VPFNRVRLPTDELGQRLAALRTDLELPGAFPAEVLAEADRAARSPDLPELDRTDLPLLTVDPPGSRDLDQALHLERRGGGYRLHYAIADLTAFVVPGGAIDQEVHRRVVTVYLPDGSVPLHPPLLAHDVASLVPDEVRPSVLWQIDLDSSGEVSAVEVERALVRSRRRLDYETVQRQVDDGTADEPLALLREVGLLRQEIERERGGVSLATPEQVVQHDADGWHLAFRASLPAEDWNAQVSLLTGMCAAGLMLDAGVGLLRTLPPPDDAAVASLRRSALALGVDWPDTATYADVVRGLDAHRPREAAVLTLAARLLRGAGYAAFDGAPPEQVQHSAVAAPYAHATAPLRRLGDRYVGAACVAICAGREVPDDLRAALPGLPGTLAAGTRSASAAERAALDLAEAVLLCDRVGEVFDAVVVDARETGGTLQLTEPAVRAPVDGPGLRPGTRLRARLAEADPGQRTVRFAPAS